MLYILSCVPHLCSELFWFTMTLILMELQRQCLLSTQQCIKFNHASKLQILLILESDSQPAFVRETRSSSSDLQLLSHFHLFKMSGLVLLGEVWCVSSLGRLDSQTFGDRKDPSDLCVRHGYETGTLKIYPERCSSYSIFIQVLEY